MPVTEDVVKLAEIVMLSPKQTVGFEGEKIIPF
jgi:hypothetical protein